MTLYRLRPYQTQAILDLRQAMKRERRVVLQAPTGSGKTVLTAHMIRASRDKGMSSWFLVHRKELLDQTSEALWDMEVPHGRIVAGHSLTKESVQVASVQTLVRRLDLVTPPDMIVVDEAHHATAASYRKILDHCPNSWVIGLTATPCRTDGTGLDDIFSGLVQGPLLTDLIEAGYLSPYRIIAPSEPMDMSGVHTRGGDWAKNEVEDRVDRATITGDAVDHYLKHVHPGTCLAYCVSRKHAHHVTEVYQGRGIDAVYVAGDTPKTERDAAIDGFRQGSPRVIVSVDLFGEGLDVPGLSAVQLLRPTQSLGLHLQQIGRALRIEEGKREAIVLDHVGNSWRHGLPDDEREWTLEGRKRRKKDEEEAALKLRHCPECFAIYAAHHRACPLCGHEPASELRKPPEQVDGQLVEIDPEEHRRRRRRRMEQGMAQSLEDLVDLALQRGNKVSWAGIVFASRPGVTLSKKDAIRQAYAIAKKRKQAV